MSQRKEETPNELSLINDNEELESSSQNPEDDPEAEESISSLPLKFRSFFQKATDHVPQTPVEREKVAQGGIKEAHEQNYSNEEQNEHYPADHSDLTGNKSSVNISEREMDSNTIDQEIQNTTHQTKQSNSEHPYPYVIPTISNALNAQQNVQNEIKGKKNQKRRESKQQKVAKNTIPLINIPASQQNPLKAQEIYFNAVKYFNQTGTQPTLQQKNGMQLPNPQIMQQMKEFHIQLPPNLQYNPFTQYQMQLMTQPSPKQNETVARDDAMQVKDNHINPRYIIPKERSKILEITSQELMPYRAGYKVVKLNPEESVEDMIQSFTNIDVVVDEMLVVVQLLEFVLYDTKTSRYVKIEVGAEKLKTRASYGVLNLWKEVFYTFFSYDGVQFKIIELFYNRYRNLTKKNRGKMKNLQEAAANTHNAINLRHLSKTLEPLVKSQQSTDQNQTTPIVLDYLNKNRPQITITKAAYPGVGPIIGMQYLNTPKNVSA